MATKQRLINANKIPYHRSGFPKGDGFDSGLDWAFREDIEKLPTVDAAEVVHCKDCQNCKVEQMSIPGDDLSRQFPVYVCKHPRGEVGTDPLYMEADDFCSYGERRTE